MDRTEQRRSLLFPFLNAKKKKGISSSVGDLLDGCSGSSSEEHNFGEASPRGTFSDNDLSPRKISSKKIKIKEKKRKTRRRKNSSTKKRHTETPLDNTDDNNQPLPEPVPIKSKRKKGRLRISSHTHGMEKSAREAAKRRSNIHELSPVTSKKASRKNPNPSPIVRRISQIVSRPKRNRSNSANSVHSQKSEDHEESSEKSNSSSKMKGTVLSAEDLKALAIMTSEKSSNSQDSTLTDEEKKEADDLLSTLSNPNVLTADEFRMYFSEPEDFSMSTSDSSWKKENGYVPPAVVDAVALLEQRRNKERNRYVLEAKMDSPLDNRIPLPEDEFTLKCDYDKQRQIQIESDTLLIEDAFCVSDMSISKSVSDEEFKLSTEMSLTESGESSFNMLSSTTDAEDIDSTVGSLDSDPILTNILLKKNRVPSLSAMESSLDTELMDDTSSLPSIIQVEKNSSFIRVSKDDLDINQRTESTEPDVKLKDLSIDNDDKDIIQEDEIRDIDEASVSKKDEMIDDTIEDNIELEEKDKEEDNLTLSNEDLLLNEEDIPDAEEKEDHRDLVENLEEDITDDEIDEIDEIDDLESEELQFSVDLEDENSVEEYEGDNTSKEGTPILMKSSSSKIKLGGAIEYCWKCHKVVYHMEKVTGVERIWHRSCYRCVKCNKVLPPLPRLEIDKEPYCRQHYTSYVR